jgi:hypothetical protein
MNSKRVFSHNTDINFNDYLKNKKGVQMMKNINSKSVNVNFFFNYDDFITLTKVYFKYSNLNINSLQVPTNIYEASTSYVLYQNILSHIKDCDHCGNCNDILKLNDCKEIKGILYPFGNYIKKISSNNVYLHTTMNLNNWCKSCDKDNVNIDDFIKEYNLTNNEYDSDDSCDCCQENNKNKSEFNDYNIFDKKYNNMYPSQNKFIFNKKEINDYSSQYEEIQRMNAYSIYPNINKKTCKKCVKRENEKTCGKYGLCKNTKPLFIKNNKK